MRFIQWLTGACALVAVSGCQLSDGPGYKPGELGNGGFIFSCDDAAACSRWSDRAEKFPAAVAVGSSFNVRYQPKTDTGLNITFNDRDPNRGITVSAVGEYVSRGPSGLVALKTGHASLVSRDAAGKVVDYVVVRVAKPDALVVYAADDVRATPVRVESTTLRKGERKSFRAFGQQKKQDLAGLLQVEWTSSAPSVVDVERANDGKVTVVAKSPGTATLTASGGTFETKVALEVSP